MKKYSRITATFAAAPLLLALGAPVAHAGVVGVSGPNFELWARSGTIVLGDGNSLATWGYSTDPTAGMQYPGPTLIVNQGDTVTVTLHNGLLVPVSAIFPGQAGVTAAPCGGSAAGLMTLEGTAATTLNGVDGGCVAYSFTATKPGTYMYQSGTRPELEVEMGLIGALIVRPTGFDVGTHDAHPARTAYDTAVGAHGYQPTHFDREYLFFLSEMDRSAHEAVDTRQQALASAVAGTYTGFDDPALDAVPGAAIDSAAFKATLWFMNGRNAPDTMLERSVAWMPNQPYNALARAHAGERLLMRIVGAGRDLHPFHHHGNNAWMIARDGQVLESASGILATYPDYNCVPEFDPDYAAHVLAGSCPSVPGTLAKTAPGTATLPDQAISNYTIQIVPGSTYDAIYTWTGKGLNWDIYGSSPGHSGGVGTCDESTRLPGEDPGSHCHVFNDAMGSRNFPVQLPEQQSLTFGGFWGGSPYLGTAEPIPPLQGGLNPGAGYSFMWHSHTERELTNDDVFPGGMMTMFILEKEPAAGDPDNICDDGTFNTGACAP